MGNNRANYLTSLTITLCLLLLPVVDVGTASALTIEYNAVDVSDPAPGQDLWRYEYRISDFTFGANAGISIFFSEVMYSSLQNPSPISNPDWQLLLFQPDSAIPADGIFFAQALTSNPTIPDPFTVDFIWLGAMGGEPGTQFFEIDQFDSSGNFVGVADTGQTSRASTSVIPEPGTSSLVIAGLAVLAGFSRKKRAVLSKRVQKLFS